MAKGRKTKRKIWGQPRIVEAIWKTCDLSEDYKANFRFMVAESLVRLVQGRAKEPDVCNIYTLYNTAYALAKMGIGEDYVSILQVAYDELVELDERAIHERIYAIRNKQSLLDLQALLDAQLNLCTVGQMEAARAMVIKAIAEGQEDWFQAPVNLD